MSRAFIKFYEEVKSVLGGKAAITALVPNKNIAPSNDPSTPDKGAMICMSWLRSNWDPHAQRGKGTFALAVGSPENKIKAQEIIDVIRDTLDEASLSESGKITVHKLRENNDAGRELDGVTNHQHEIILQYDVLLIDGND